LSAPEAEELRESDPAAPITAEVFRKLRRLVLDVIVLFPII